MRDRIKQIERGTNRLTGFSMIEILVVVGIITIIVTLAIPTTKMAVRSAKEAACVKALKSIYQAMAMYERDNGYSAVKTSAPSTQFMEDLDTYLPESYLPRHATNVMIKGYRLLGWVPESASNPTWPGAGPTGSAGAVTYDRDGSRNWRIIALPIEPYSGLSTFYLDPNGNVSRELDGNPV
jgi:type II secretory pathway pseudopilin PulG